MDVDELACIVIQQVLTIKREQREREGGQTA
jgi:hypothetical protein